MKMNFDHLLSTQGPLGWKFYGTPLGFWIGFIVVGLVLFGILLGLRRSIAARLGVIAALTGVRLQKLISDLVCRTHAIFLLATSFYAASLLIIMGPRAEDDAHVAFSVILLCQIGIWLNHALSWVLDEYVEVRKQPDTQEGLATAVSALRFLARIGVWSIVVLLVLSNLHINVTTLIAGLGVGGVAVALALQNILGDLFASLSILLDKPFAVGHFIVVDNLTGTVEYVGVKSTRIRSIDGEELIISNSDLLKSRIHNYERSSERRVLLKIGVTYDTAYEKLKAIPEMAREVVESVGLTRFDRARFITYGDSSLNFEVVYFVSSTDYRVYLDVQHEVNLGLFKKFGDESIDFAFPTQTLYLNVPTANSSEPRSADAGSLPRVTSRRPR
jgi:small-conductance mechanosensitive channel